jgi:hypothetical protein
MLSDVFHNNRQAVLDTLILITVCTVYLTENRAHGGSFGQLQLIPASCIQLRMYNGN